MAWLLCPTIPHDWSCKSVFSSLSKWRTQLQQHQQHQLHQLHQPVEDLEVGSVAEAEVVVVVVVEAEVVAEVVRMETKNGFLQQNLEDW